MDEREQERMLYFKQHQMPLECHLHRGDWFCEAWLEKEFYIVQVEVEYLPTAKRKGKWSYYTGFCKMHFNEGLKDIKSNIRWCDKHKENKLARKIRIGHIWKITEAKS